jgi:hypothetical protein
MEKQKQDLKHLSYYKECLGRDSSPVALKHKLGTLLLEPVFFPFSEISSFHCPLSPEDSIVMNMVTYLM